MNKMTLFSIFSIFLLSGCSSTKPMFWGEKELKYGPTCEAEGLEKGSPEYLACVAESYNDDAGTSPAYDKNHNTSASAVGMPWEKNQDTGNRVSHSYGRSESSRPDISIINKGVNW